MATVRDRWVEHFECPVCGKTGTANLTSLVRPLTQHRHGDHLTAVDNLTDGFKAVGDPRDIDVICTTCNVSAWP
jgi:hypothetical protein